MVFSYNGWPPSFYVSLVQPMKSSPVYRNDAMQGVNPFRVMSVMQRASELEAEGRKIVHMEVGEPDFVTAEPIVAAAHKALDAGHTRYTPATGIPALRDCLVQHYREQYGVEVERQRILITPGASGGLSLLAHLLVSADAGVLLADPAYPCVRNFIRLVRGQPQLVPVGREENYQPTVKGLDAAMTSNSCGLWLASPANPSGTILSREQLSLLTNWSRGNKLHVLVDEIYHGLHYVDDLPSVLEIDQDAFVVNSFSKYFGMTGWRLGWIVVPESHVEQAMILAQNLFISAPSIAQHAALAAFSPEASAIFEERRSAFCQRRDFLSAKLQDLGFALPLQIQGAFYIYADISNFGETSEQFCRRLLEDHGVAVTPGTDFGEHAAQQHVRFAFTTSMSDLELGVERLSRALS